MRVFYDFTVWEEVDENNVEQMKSKFMEFGKRLQGFGIISFAMRSGNQQTQYTPEQLQQIQQIQQQRQQEQQQQQQISETPQEQQQEVVEE